ncbi:hypothetical protein STEG23_022247, partial [Scotinomys teguina]
DTMGQTVTTPLSLTLSHWSDVRACAHNQGVEVRKKKWITLCEAEWVMMDDPTALTNLIESILVTHRPTWEDYQQLLQTLLTVEEKNRVFLEARKQVPGKDGRPTPLPNVIDATFPLTRPNWDFTTPEVRQYPMSHEAYEGIKPHIRRLLDQGILVPCRSPWNTPLLPFTDGSSFLQNGERKTGATVTTESEVVWASPLPPGTSAQRAELVALTQALKLAEGKRLTVYTDSRYAFATAHIHGEIYRRRGLLTSEGKEIKNKKEILDLLRALFLPRQLSIIHCPGHQKADSPIARGNRMADLTARAAALEELEAGKVLALRDQQMYKDPPQYSSEDHELAKKMGAEWDQTEQMYKKGDKLVMPTSHTKHLIKLFHTLTHLSKSKMKALLTGEATDVVLLNQDKVLQQVTSSCSACAQVNSGKAHLSQGVRARGHRPGVRWEIDFTEVKPGLYGYKYLLVFIDTFSGWVEAFPTKKETSNVVTKKLLEDIFPRYGMPQVLGSDNGPAFVSQSSGVTGIFQVYLPLPGFQESKLQSSCLDICGEPQKYEIEVQLCIISYTLTRPRDPQALTGLIESILLTHQPTWEDCQQLLQTLLTTEERQRVFLEARKNVPGDDGRPTQLPNEIDDAFPLTRPNWDFNTAAGRDRLRLYRQILLAGLKGAGRRPTNLAKVRAIVQGPEETPAGYLERLMEGYRMYTPFDPQAQDRQADIIMSFIGQSAPDIRTKLQRLEGLQGYTLQDLVKEAEKIFNKRETPEEKEERLRREQEHREDMRDKRRNRELTKILATVVTGAEQNRPRQNKYLGDKRRPRVEHDQCAYCKEKGHWVKDCPVRAQKGKTRKPVPVLSLEED